MTSTRGNYYFMSFINDYSRRCWVYTTRYKRKVLELSVQRKRNMEKNTKSKIKVLYLDNGEEYTSDHFLQLYRNECIERHFTVRETSQQNGVDERMNKTLLEKFHCMLSNARLLKSFWVEILAYACHLVNRLPSSAIGGKTLLKVWSEKVTQDYNSRRYLLSDLLSCQGRQAGSESEERYVHRIQKWCKMLKCLGS